MILFDNEESGEKSALSRVTWKEILQPGFSRSSQYATLGFKNNKRSPRLCTDTGWFEVQDLGSQIAAAANGDPDVVEEP